MSRVLCTHVIANCLTGKPWKTSCVDDALKPTRVDGSFVEKIRDGCRIAERGAKSPNDEATLVSFLASHNFRTSMTTGKPHGDYAEFFPAYDIGCG